MKKYTKYKVLAILITSFFIVSYEWVRHYYFIHYLPKDTDILLSSILFIIVSIIISQWIFSALEKLDLKSYQKEMEAKTIFDNSVDGIFVLGAEGQVLDMNEGAKNLSGWGGDEPLTFEFLFNKKLPSLESWQGSVKTETPHIIESYLKKKDGEQIPISLTLSNMNDLPFGREKIAVIVRDLSERKQMENVIRDLYAEATQKHYETEILYQISSKMATIRDPNTREAQATLNAVSTHIQNVLNVHSVAVFLNLSDKEGYTLTASTQGAEIPDEGILENKKWEEFEFMNDDLFIPFQNNEEILGFITAQGAEKIKDSLQQQELVRSIKQIFSITIENSRLYQKLKGITIIEERERLAREMHDGLAQEINSISVKLQVLKSLTNTDRKGSIDTVRVQQLANDLEDITNQAYHEIRQHLFNLRTPFQMEQLFTESLAKYANLFEKHFNIQVDLTLDESLMKEKDFLSPEKKMHVIRIIQEALSNIRKHANATHVTISVEDQDGAGWVITIEDNGIGFALQDAEESKDHYGLEIMKERAQLYGGGLTIESTRGEGTRVLLSIP